MNKKLFLIAGVPIFLLACGVTSNPQPTLVLTSIPTPTITASFLSQPEPATVAPVLITPSLIPTTLTSVFQGPGEVFVPILLYHRIAVSLTDSQYYVSPDKFEEQIKLLHDWEYTTITTETLVKAITEGAALPPRPILITFDDGNLDNYTTAFPIMQKYGFSGVLYIIDTYVGADKYMNVDQIKEMVSAGWEVGSHSMTHLELTTLDPDQQQYEIIESRRFLENKLGVPVLTFAYPFGISDTVVINTVYSAGYIAGMGLGYTFDQGTSNLFSLQRRGVNGTHDLKLFASFLPWQGDPSYLPTDTPTPLPTPSRTPIPTNTLFPTSTSSP
jgi:peptidoglycan/xylan/chitin deacetylase (PgdA/CDA1 family)